MAKFVRQATRLTIVLHLLLLLSYAESFKILAKRDLLNPDISSGCPVAQLGRIINPLLDTACRLLGSVFFAIEGPLLTRNEQLRPEPGYYFQEPNATGDLPDQRGPCPGLNLLANYGYLPRNGIVTFGQVVEASVRGFNMGVDLASFLTTYAILSSGNIATETFSIGAPDPRVGIGSIGGLDRHSCIEADISPTREDYYTGDCDAHHLSSRMFKQLVEFARQQQGLFNFAAMTDQYAKTANYSKAKNPYLFYFPAPSIFSLAVHVFYPYFFSNGTYEFGGTLDYTTISNIVGANLTTNGSDYNFQYVPERWPEVSNSAGKPWYRRATQFGILQATSRLPLVYAKNPVGMPFGQLGTSNLTPQTIACDLYLALLQFTPAFAAQTQQDIAYALAWAISKLDPVFANTTLGCPSNAFSSNGGNFSTYPYQNVTGSATNPVPAGCLETANRYYETYFSTAPK